jgi:glycosyltransferase involved in cell wall biosynthesis
MNCKFSVIIPLYNKLGDIAATLASALAQSRPPHEIVVVDDGSTDGSGDVVRTFDSPLIRLIVQPNAGECAARNRAMTEATGDFFALLDADDRWEADYLATIASLIERYPDCGAYCTAFTVVGATGDVPSRSPGTEGVIDDYFRRALDRCILLPSETTLRREVVEQVGGFPDGMKLGGDQLMWVKLVAAGWKVACSPLRMMRYSVVAANRSSAIYTAERTEYSFRDYYVEGDFWRNEYLARVEINKAIVVSAKGGAAEARDVERFYRYTRRSRLAWHKLWILNRLPLRLRAPLLKLYNLLAWRLAKKGM